MSTEQTPANPVAATIKPGQGTASFSVQSIPRGADGAVDPNMLIKPREAVGRTPPPAAAAGPQPAEPAPAPQADPGLKNLVAGVMNNLRAPQPAPRTPRQAPPAPAADVPPVQTPAAPVVPDSVLPPAEPAAPGDIPDAPPDSHDAKATYTWGQLRKAAKESEAAAAAAKAEAEAKALELQKTSEVLAKLQRERDAAQEQLEKTDLLNSPTFHERYEGKINAATQELIANLSQVLETPEQASLLADKLLKSSQKEFVEVLNKLPAVFQPLAFSARTTVAKTLQDREAAIKDWKATRAALAEQSAKDQRIKLATDVERGAAMAAENLVKNGNFLLQKTGDPAWDAQADAIVANAKMTLAQPRSQQDIVDLVLEGASAAKTRELLIAERQRVKQLELQLKSLGTPPASTVRPAPAPAPVTPPAPRTPPSARRPSLIQDVVSQIVTARR